MLIFSFRLFAFFLFFGFLFVFIFVFVFVSYQLGSHRRQEPYYDADLGDVLSFWERLKEQCEIAHRDVFLVNNGDFVDGTGLSETIDGNNNPEYLIPLLEKMPYDAVNVGNHELYSKKNIEYMTRPGGYVDWWGDRYLTSNIHRIDEPSNGKGTETDMDTDIITNSNSNSNNAEATKEPLGNRYKILHGENSNLLVFGFLYNMRNYATGAGIEIQKVQETVQEQWFLDALLGEDYDAILVLAHMDLVDPCVNVLQTAIRDTLEEKTATTPIVFATGHTHYRGVKQLEDLTLTFEAGRYLDTVGFVSIPKKESVLSSRDEETNDAPSSVFGYVFLDANKKVLFEDTLGFSSAECGETKDGTDFSAFIEHTRKRLGLEDEIGCAPHSYHVNRHLDATDSLWGLYRDQVVPQVFSVEHAMATIEGGETDQDKEEETLPMAMLLQKGDWRYDLYSNASMVVDDVYAISPFNDTVVHMGTFSANVILEANKTLNHKHSGMLPSFILIGDLAGSSSSSSSSSGSSSSMARHTSASTANTKYHLYTHKFGVGSLQSALKKIVPSDETIKPRETGYTSSLIWLAFVKKYWPCDQKVVEIPNDSSNINIDINNDNINDNDNDNKDNSKDDNDSNIIESDKTTPNSIPIIAGLSLVVVGIVFCWVKETMVLVHKYKAINEHEDVLEENERFI